MNSGARLSPVIFRNYSFWAFSNGLDCSSGRAGNLVCHLFEFYCSGEDFVEIPVVGVPNAQRLERFRHTGRFAQIMNHDRKLAKAFDYVNPFCPSIYFQISHHSLQINHLHLKWPPRTRLDHAPPSWHGHCRPPSYSSQGLYPAMR